MPHAALRMHAHRAAHLPGVGEHRGCAEAKAERGRDADCEFV